VHSDGITAKHLSHALSASSYGIPDCAIRLQKKAIRSAELVVLKELGKTHSKPTEKTGCVGVLYVRLQRGVFI
jgi:hypothetical protein